MKTQREHFRFSEAVSARLQQLSESTGRTKTQVVEDAILRGVIIEDETAALALKLLSKDAEVDQRRAVGLKAWPQDVLRHAAASYLLASGAGLDALSRALGNSPGILMRHYMEIVPPEQAREWLGILPRTNVTASSPP